MAIITLTSDWGASDFYAAAVKGRILSMMPEVIIVDITHNIRQFDIESAAFTVRHSYACFPKGTVHIIAVNTEESTEHPHSAVFYDGHYFIGTDNGLFSLIFGDKPEAAYEIDIMQDTGYFTFSTRDRFVKAAVMLLNGTPIHELGPERLELTSKLLFEPTVTADAIRGMVAHIDAYENAITNISYSLFHRIRKNRPFEIVIMGYSISKIVNGYDDVPRADLLALCGSHQMLEIALNQGKAASLCGFERQTLVLIEFF